MHTKTNSGTENHEAGVPVLTSQPENPQSPSLRGIVTHQKLNVSIFLSRHNTDMIKQININLSCSLKNIRGRLYLITRAYLSIPGNSYIKAKVIAIKLERNPKIYHDRNPKKALSVSGHATLFCRSIEIVF